MGERRKGSEFGLNGQSLSSRGHKTGGLGHEKYEAKEVQLNEVQLNLDTVA